MHCLDDDATGIIVAASIVPALRLVNGWDALIEYAAGFCFGLCIFQALMMAGMIPVMLILADVWPYSEDPAEPAFWFCRSLASIAGGVLAFPISIWLVRIHLKY